MSLDDRLGRNLDDLRKLVFGLTDRVRVEFRKEYLVFTGEVRRWQNLLLSVMGAIAEFERQLIRERQRKGIEVAKKTRRVSGHASNAKCGCCSLACAKACKGPVRPVTTCTARGTTLNSARQLRKSALTAILRARPTVLTSPASKKTLITRLGSPGSQCVACHMPKIATQGVPGAFVTSRRFRFVTPARTDKYQIRTIARTAVKTNRRTGQPRSFSRGKARHPGGPRRSKSPAVEVGA
jgi:hypothetical protein